MKLFFETVAGVSPHAQFRNSAFSREQFLVCFPFKLKCTICFLITSCSLTYSTFHIICYTASIGRFFEEEHAGIHSTHDEFPRIWLGLTLGSCRAILGLTFGSILKPATTDSPKFTAVRLDHHIPILSTFFAKLVA